MRKDIYTCIGEADFNLNAAEYTQCHTYWYIHVFIKICKNQVSRLLFFVRRYSRFFFLLSILRFFSFMLLLFLLDIDVVLRPTIAITTKRKDNNKRNWNNDLALHFTRHLAQVFSLLPELNH